MENNKNFLPYIITIFGTLNTESNDLDKMQEELRQTNFNYLISHADRICVEADIDELKRSKGELKEINPHGTERLEDIKLIEIIVTKKNIIEQDRYNINGALKLLRKDIKNSQSKLKITFSKWDDKHEAFEVEEIRKYVQELFKENQDLFYFLTDEANNSKLVLSCLAKLKEVKNESDNKTTYDFQIPDDVIEKIMDSMMVAFEFDKTKAKEKADNLFEIEWEE